MQLITDKKKEKKELIAKIQSEFKFLMADSESQKTPIYKALADKYRITERTIFSYCKNI